MTEQPVRFHGVPERVELADGATLRRYTDEDIPALVETVNANIGHLRPWMPWATEPVTEQAQLAWLRESRQHWDEGSDFVYGIFDAAGRLVGGTGYHVRNGPGVIEIGYWLAADATGRGLATAVTAALTDLATRIPGVERIEIRCDEANVRSSAIPRRLGFELVGVEEREPSATGDTGRDMIWSIDAATVVAQNA
jgi:RimJ/RimL family protein N-acetyltransferase